MLNLDTNAAICFILQGKLNTKNINKLMPYNQKYITY